MRNKAHAFRGLRVKITHQTVDYIRPPALPLVCFIPSHQTSRFQQKDINRPMSTVLSTNKKPEQTGSVLNLTGICSIICSLSYILAL